jgi:hypothetical protein
MWGQQGRLTPHLYSAAPLAAATLKARSTLAQFRKVTNGKAQVYVDDYAAISELQKLASKYVAIVIVHHDRKGGTDDVWRRRGVDHTGGADEGGQGASRSALRTGGRHRRGNRPPCGRLRVPRGSTASRFPTWR